MITNHSMNTNTNNTNTNGKTELLKELIQNDPYLAFFIHFFADIGLIPILYNPVINTYTNTKFYAIDKKTIIIEQNQKRLEIRIRDAKQLLKSLYGPIPLELY
jgi:hypothetical protein